MAAVTLLLGACATPLDPVRDAQVEPVAVAAVQAEPARFRHTRVRWGGTIVAVRNEPATTVIEVLSRPLKPSGAPALDMPGTGRFHARIPEFLDPSEYGEGRWLTVVGAVSGAEEGRVGEYPYVFPLVDVEHYRLWRSREEIDPPRYDYGPWWWDPWYHPWWHRPYWRHHPFWW